MLQQSQTKDINRDEYNGWKNRETWLINLWINNDPYLQQELVYITELEDGIYLKVQMLKELVENIAFDHLDEQSDMSSDLINTAIARADLREIVELNED